ncbi:hypothetical protein DL98DRAFT_657255 [Cadophora sp. DSE1049]|nr:hypothetical protein DL98DRAFT_657255 [Cadophora sp. DSE1049]
MSDNIPSNRPAALEQPSPPSESNEMSDKVQSDSPAPLDPSSSPSESNALGDNPPESRWNSRNDPKGHARSCALQVEHGRAYERIWSKFSREVKKLKDTMKDELDAADKIDRQARRELAETLKKEKEERDVGTSQTAPSQIAEDVAREIEQSHALHKAQRPIMEAAIETLGSSIAIVYPRMSPKPAASMTVGTDQTETDLPATSNHAKTTSNMRKRLAETKSSSSEKRKRTNRTKDNRTKRENPTTKEDEKSPAVVLFEIESVSLMDGPLKNNNFVLIPKSSVPVRLGLGEEMMDYMSMYSPVKVHADDDGWYVVFGLGSIGEVRAKSCFESLQGKKFSRYFLKMSLFGKDYVMVESTV